MVEYIKRYFIEKYKDAKFTVVPGRLPDFKSKEEVDEWINESNLAIEQFFDFAKSRRKDNTPTSI